MWSFWCTQLSAPQNAAINEKQTLRGLLLLLLPTFTVTITCVGDAIGTVTVTFTATITGTGIGVGATKLTFCNHIAVDETVRYTPHPNDPEKTLLQQEAVVTVSGVPLTHYMEELLTSKICFNSGMGRQAMEWVIEKLHLEEFDDLLSQTVRQFDDLTTKTRRGMDDLQSAIKSFDEIHNLTSNPSSQSMPKF
ncbi:hypothetical protein M0804_008884 [Polistes exclamans]|nr:hypothetical protein M0804_008884 [Polistes exclamans]